MGFDDVLEILDEKWPANRTLMLRTVSKNVKEIVDLIKPRIVVKIKYKQKAVETISLRLDVMSKKYNITSLVLLGCSDYCNKNNNLALVINNSPALEKLYLSYNRITDDILNSIIEPLKNCRALKYLNLSQNYIDGKMIANIISMLPQWQKLKYIDLSNNNIPSVVAFLLFKQYKREQKKAKTQTILIL
jgi:Ran GTPase-activating protein (RanGAP) involved in mRNA processing and transport